MNVRTLILLSIGLAGCARFGFDPADDPGSNDAGPRDLLLDAPRDRAGDSSQDDAGAPVFISAFVRPRCWGPEPRLLNAAAIDPLSDAGVAITYEAKTGGSVELRDSGILWQFTPPDGGPHPCPHQVVASATSVGGLTSVVGIDVWVTPHADVNRDGVVDAVDLDLVNDFFGAVNCCTTLNPCFYANVDSRNCVIDVDDTMAVTLGSGETGCACPNGPYPPDAGVGFDATAR